MQGLIAIIWFLCGLLFGLILASIVYGFDRELVIIGALIATVGTVFAAFIAYKAAVYESTKKAENFRHIIFYETYDFYKKMAAYVDEMTRQTADGYTLVETGTDVVDVCLSEIPSVLIGHDGLSYLSGKSLGYVIDLKRGITSVNAHRGRNAPGLLSDCKNAIAIYDEIFSDLIGPENRRRASMYNLNGRNQ